MKVLELFSGFECISNAFREKGHECFTIDWDERFPSSMHCDISKLQIEDLPEEWRHPDVVFAGTQCFEKGTLVYTNKGYKEIQDIKCKDYVLTHTGKYKQVYQTFKTSKTDIWKIKISGCEWMECSGEHPFYARKKHSYSTRKGGYAHRVSELLEPEWIKAKNLTNEYKVGIPINQESIIPNWEGSVINMANNSGVYKSYIKKDLQKYMGSPDFWWLIGRYFGDGSLGIPNTKLNKKRGYVEICCAMDEIKEIKEVIDKLEIKYSERDQHIHHFYFFNAELYDFLLQFGKGALNKEITPLILNLPKYLLRKFLEGYISADGHWDNTLVNPVCTITTISRKLAYGIQQCILKAYERYGSITINENPNNIICGRTVNVHKTYTVGFYKNKTNRLQYHIEDGMGWVNVKNVIKQPTKQHTLYNLSVEDDESYTVNNICVHNCTTYSVAAISKHRRKDPDTGNLLPISEQAKHDDDMNRHVRELIKQMNPKIQIWENPMGAFRKMDFIQDLILNTTTYCNYGFTYRKQTDFLSNIDLHLKPPCKNGSPCHEKAPRGARTGLQAIKDPALKAIYPPKLCEHIVEECEKYIYKGEN